MFNPEEEDEAEERRRLQQRAERSRALAFTRREHELEKALGTDANPHAAAAADDDDEDPLDAYMREHVEGAAQKEAEQSAQRHAAWQLQYGSSDVHIDESEPAPEADTSKHCYICKRWGHTKAHCPQRKCLHCGKPGHSRNACPVLDEKLIAQADADRKRKRAKQYAAKKEKRAREWEEHLRRATGVDGVHVLYEILGLPPRQLATKEAIRRAYRIMTLRYHPDKVSEEEADEAREKFLAVQTAYELLLEGMERGGDSGASPVYVAGELAYVPGQRDGDDARSVAAASVTGAAGSEGGEVIGAADRSKASFASAPRPSESSVLTEEELSHLLQQPLVAAAVRDVAADISAVRKYAASDVVIGVLYSIAAHLRSD